MLRRSYLGDAVSHSHIPPMGSKVSVVEITEHDPVVGVGRAAIGVFVDVMDFTPRCRDITARDHATLVAECDGFALMRGEYAAG